MRVALRTKAGLSLTSGSLKDGDARRLRPVHERRVAGRGYGRQVRSVRREVQEEGLVVLDGALDEGHGPVREHVRLVFLLAGAELVDACRSR